MTGGGVDVASTYAEANSRPVVRAYVGTGTTVRIGGSLTVDEITFAETRAYVTKVLNARKAYRRTYARELGL